MSTTTIIVIILILLLLGGGGYGLVGMRERAELIDGTLVTGPDGKGFRVSLRVPA